MIDWKEIWYKLYSTTEFYLYTLDSEGKIQTSEKVELSLILGDKLEDSIEICYPKRYIDDDDMEWIDDIPVDFYRYKTLEPNKTGWCFIEDLDTMPKAE